MTVGSQSLSHATDTRRPAKPRRRRGLRVVLLLVVLAVIAGAVVLSTRPDSVRITPYHGSVPSMRTPTGYRITYKVIPAKSSSYTEDLFVRRPFDAFDANIAHGKPYLTLVMRLGQQVFRSGNGTASLVYTPIAPARRDIRLDAVARDAIRAHRLRIVGRGKVLGSSCVVFRSGGPLNAGPLMPIARNSYVDSCIDGRGLLLYERTIAGNKLATRRVATRVAVGRAAASADYSMEGDELAPEKGGGAMRRLTLESRPSSGPFWDIAHAPQGFRHTGRYALVPSQPDAYGGTGGKNAFGLPNSLVASIDDVYVRGTDAVVIEQGSTVNDAQFSPPDGGIPVDLGPVLGHAQLLLSATGSEVVAEPHEGRRFVRVVGTLPPDELVRIAKGMTLQPPGEMKKL